MPTTLALDTPQQVAATGTWVELRLPAHATYLTVQATTNPVFVRWGGVVEGAAIGTGYLSVPAGGTGSFALPGTRNGEAPRPSASSAFIAQTAVATSQVQVSR